MAKVSCCTVRVSFLSSSTTAPAMWGAAIEVPVNAQLYDVSPVPIAEQMLVPGATACGRMVPSQGWVRRCW